MMTSRTKKETKEEIQKVFELFTTSGAITLENLKQVAKDLGENMSEEELQEMIEHADKAKAGAVGPDDFYRLMMKGNKDKNLDDLLEED